MELLSLLFISTLIVAGATISSDGGFVLKFFIAEVSFVSLVIAALCLLA